MVVRGGELLACAAVGVLGSDGTGRGGITGVGVVGVGLAGGGVARSGPVGGGVARSGPVGAGALGGVAWRVWVEGGSGVDGPVVSVSSVGVGPGLGVLAGGSPVRWG